MKQGITQMLLKLGWLVVPSPAPSGLIKKNWEGSEDQFSWSHGAVPDSSQGLCLPVFSPLPAGDKSSVPVF